MKMLRWVLLAACLSFTISIHARQAYPPPGLQALIEAAETTTLYPASATPKFGNFYSAQFGGFWPPIPGNPLNLPFWSFGDGFYILDDRDVDYSELQAEAELMEEMSSSSSSTMSSTLAYGNPVYLTNLVAISSNAQPVIASFSVAGGTNNVPYDILTTSNLSNALSSWSWLGIGYTSNRYTFSNQPLNQAYYILTRPQKTMVFGWGDDVDGQCDVPSGISNALMVAGGDGQSLALLNDGTLRAWGSDDHDKGSVPSNAVGVTMIACGWNHDVALLTNGNVIAWGVSGDNLTPPWHLLDVPADLTNAAVISAQALHTLAIRSNGMVVAWGLNSFGETTIPAGLSNVVAIAAGFEFSLAAKADGTMTAWGDNRVGQCNYPGGLSNVVDVAAGPYHGLALLRDGTVAAWGNTHGVTNVPSGLTNVVAIAASGDFTNGSAFCIALKSDGTVVTWGDGQAVAPLLGATNIIGIAAGTRHGLAIRTGPRTPVLTLCPADQFALAGSNVTFTARGAGLYGVTYQWQSNGVNIAGATNVILALTNVQAAQQAAYRVAISNEVGAAISSNANFYLVTTPALLSRTPTTNPVAIFAKNQTLSVAISAAGQSNGFPLSFQWELNGTAIPGATTSAYSFLADSNSIGAYSVTVANAAGSTNSSWQVTMTYVGSYVDVGTLAYHLSTNAVGRTNGFTASFTNMLELTSPASTNLDRLTNAVWSTNFWLHGVEGLSATPIGFSNVLGGAGFANHGFAAALSLREPYASGRPDACVSGFEQRRLLADDFGKNRYSKFVQRRHQQ